MVVQPCSGHYLQSNPICNPRLQDFHNSSLYSQQPKDLSTRTSGQGQSMRNSNPVLYSQSLQNRRTLAGEESARSGFPYQYNRSFPGLINSSRNKKSYSFNCPRKRTFSDSGSSSDTANPAKRQRTEANVRERERTKQLNSYFSDLRRKVPSLPSDKLSKIQTLRFAMDYIAFLKHVLDHGLEFMCTDVSDAWSSSNFLTHKILSQEFLFRRMQNAWAIQKHPHS